VLPQKQRLSKQKDFENIKQAGEGRDGRLLGVKAAANGLEYFRLAVIVGTKISKGAVARNRLKRQVRAVFIKYAKTISSGYDYLVIAKPAITGYDYESIEKDLFSCLKQLNLIKADDIK
jgi:ribonuclease P protein component